MKEKFACVINCMDGRVQFPILNFVKEFYGVDYVDSITEAGPVGLLTTPSGVESFKKKIKISVEKHGSDTLVVCAHHDCAGNPHRDEIQKEMLVTAAENLHSVFPNLKVAAVWVNDKWGCELLLELSN